MSAAEDIPYSGQNKVGKTDGSSDRRNLFARTVHEAHIKQEDAIRTAILTEEFVHNS